MYGESIQNSSSLSSLPCFQMLLILYFTQTPSVGRTSVPVRHRFIVQSYTYLALGHLIIVMGKLEIHASGVNVHLLSDNVTGHHRALNVPSRAPLYAKE